MKHYPQTQDEFKKLFPDHPCGYLVTLHNAPEVLTLFLPNDFSSVGEVMRSYVLINGYTALVTTFDVETPR